MKLYIKLAALCLLLNLYGATAQTPQGIAWIKQRTDVTALLKSAEGFRQEGERNRKKAFRYAKRFNWPLEKNMKNGGVAHLVGITENLQPLYIQPLNAGSAATVRADRLYTGGGLGLNVQGENMKIGIWDIGLPKFDHELLSGKLNNMSPGGFVNWHPTSMAGTILGKYLDANPRARGIAFMATADCYDASTYYDIPDMQTAAANGLIISNHSYTRFGYYPTYSERASDLDSITYLAPYYLPVFACGNSNLNPNPATYYLTGDACAKNILAVANTHEVRNYTGPASVLIYAGPDAGASSWGPTTDFRIKPDIAAKGNGTYTSKWYSVNSYGLEGGTSSASAATSGTLLLLQQHYYNTTSTYMRSATLKCLAIHTAYEAGPYAGPDIKFGWGLLNAEEAAKVILDKGKSAIIEENTINNSGSGSSYTKTVTASGGQALKVSICWTDRRSTDFSTSTTTRLINDLDIRVSDGTNTYYPWRLDESNITGAALNNGDNNKDNIERIDISNPVFGATYTITITHKGNLFNNAAQNYSLIVTGITNCTLSSPDLVLTAPITSSIEYKGYNSITSTSLVSGNINVKFWANADILNQGFMADRASSAGYFLAFAGPCQDPNNTLKHAEENEDMITEIVQQDTSSTVLNEKNADFLVKLLPNPSNGKFKIYLGDPETGNVEVYDVSGKIIYALKFVNTNLLEADISKMTRGTYLVKIGTSKGVIFKKIILQ